MTPALSALALLAASPSELGDIPWQRGLDAALAEAGRAGRPALVLFNEVPGCSTVNTYAEEVLSHPLVVDAAALFVPVFVSNNDGDAADQAALQRYGEPAWNNPVLRIVDGRGAMLAPRITHDSGAIGLLTAMVQALDRTKASVPEWLRVVTDAQRPSVTKTFACACFWEGESTLGALAGVRTTEAGFVDGREVVRVQVDAAHAGALEAAARAHGYKPVSTGAFKRAPGDDDKHALARSAWSDVPMTLAQRTRVNAALAAGTDPRALLAPSQQRALHDNSVRSRLRARLGP